VPQSLGLLPRDEALALLRDPARFAAPGDTLDSAVALAERLRAGDGEILVVTDRAPVRPLPPGSRHLAFGRPLPNAALSARRALSSDGTESLLLSLRRFPASAEPLRVSVEFEGSQVPGSENQLDPLNFTLSTDEPKAFPLPSGCPTLRVSIPEDALALDNEATLPTAVPPPVPVDFDLAAPALLSLARRAVQATGLAVSGAGAGSPSPDGRAPSRPVLLTDSAERLRAHRGPALLLLPAADGPESRLLAGPWLRDPVDPILEGVDFTGLAWPLASPKSQVASPLPGRPILYCADAPVLSVLANGEFRTYALRTPPPSSPFFRSTAWPSLVYNLLALAQPPSTPSTPSTSSESDLSSCATLTLAGPPLPPSESSGDLRPLALFFGLAAFLLLLLRLAFAATRGPGRVDRAVFRTT
ncbi:MAG: hypothetical protein II839_08700, partial [Kiritimatiellae bacterium]|nr:hypothetical protein [Kiritimatiellia bacterium]